MSLRCNRFAVAAVILALACTGVSATKVRPESVDDPFSEDECPGMGIMSWGSYIYNAPSKYDGVFWPATEEYWVWSCAKSGYTSLGDDFEELSGPERKRIGRFLADNYDATRSPTHILDRLTWAERIYRLRDKDDVFWAYFYRLMAHWNDHEGDPIEAQAYRRRALPLLAQLAESTPSGVDRIQFLFLAGEYHRRLGNGDRARAYFERAKTLPWTDDDGNARRGHPYFSELVTERESIAP